MNVAVRIRQISTKARRRFGPNGSFAIIALALFVAGIALGRADVERVDADKSYWLGLTDAEQIVAIRAALDAYGEGWEDGVLADSGRIAGGLADAVSASNLTRSTASLIDARVIYQKDANGHFVAFAHRPAFSRTFGYYQASMTDFYTIHNGVDAVTIGAIVECLADRPIYSCDSIAKSLSQ